MIDPAHLLIHVIRPVLKDLDLWSASAERLLLGTACQESECGRWLVQLGNVPMGGCGIYQMELATHQDLWENFILNRPTLEAKVRQFKSPWFSAREELTGNLSYATAMCRVHYLRDPRPIPEDLPGQAEYWKRVYNTAAGKGEVNQYINNWNRFVLPGVI